MLTKRSDNYGTIRFLFKWKQRQAHSQELGNLEEFGDELEQLQNKDVRKEKLMEYEYLSDEEIERE